MGQLNCVIKLIVLLPRMALLEVGVINHPLCYQCVVPYSIMLALCCRGVECLEGKGRE